MSYKCEENLLGERDPPPKKIRKRKKRCQSEISLSQVIHIYIKIECSFDYNFFQDMKDYFNSTDEDTENEAEETVADEETLSAAIALEVSR